MVKDRMPPIAETDLNKEQISAVKALISGPRGGLRGPFIPMLRSPEFMNRAQLLGEYLRYDSVIDKPLREFAILVSARIWQQTYEWHVHSAIAEKEGVPRSWISQLEEHGNVSNLSSDYQLIYNFCHQLHTTHAITDKLFVQARRQFSEQGIIELCGICGYYAMLAMILNVAQTPVPQNKEYSFGLPVAKDS